MTDTRPRMVKIIITGYPSLQNAINALNQDADAYIQKPFNAKNVCMHASAIVIGTLALRRKVDKKVEILLILLYFTAYLLLYF